MILGRTLIVFVVSVASLFATPDRLSAERLPITYFSTADGLPHFRIVRIVQDSHGFIWFCTPQGLSRFDGQSFVSYGVDEGLPHSSVTDLLEVDGAYWIATNGGGVARFDTAPASQPSQSAASFPVSIFAVGDSATTMRVNVLYRDRRGSIWAGTDGGLFRRSADTPETGFVQVPLHLQAHPESAVQIWALLEDESGALWIGSRFGLLRRAADGQTIQYAIDPRGTIDHVRALLYHEGRLWLGHDSGLIVFRPPSSPPYENRDLEPRAATVVGNVHQLPDVPGDARRYQPIRGEPVAQVKALALSSSGSVWIGIEGGGLAEFHDGRFAVYTRRHGLNDLLVQAITEDRGGNIWAGTYNGAMRITRGGFVAYGESDGLGPIVGSVFVRNGVLYATSHEFLISRFDGKMFTTVRPRLSVEAAGWRPQSVLMDRSGEWWIATRNGVFRFARVSRFEQLRDAEPSAAYTVRDGLADNDVAGLFEDARGDVWMAHFAPGHEVLTRWDRATNTLHRYSSRQGLRPLASVTAFGEDASGQLWIGFRDGEVVRYRAGRFVQEVPPAREPERSVSSIQDDEHGRIWISIRGKGLLRIDARADGPERLRLYTTSDGLASNSVGVIALDARGDVYIEVGSVAIDKLDLRTDEIRHFTSSDGVPRADVLGGSRDDSGSLWFATTAGLLRFTPGDERTVGLPVVRIGGLQIDGAPAFVPPLGATALGPFVLAPGRNRLEITFFGLTPSLDAGLRFQYRLDGAKSDWSAPSAQRTLTFASLAPGRYRLLVRALGPDGRASETPATLAFTVLPPVWQRWWFLVIAACIVTTLAYIIHRARVVRIIELERVRTRIATDLHDDIGSGLSQVAMLTELLDRRVGSDSRMSEPLSAIGDVSRDLIDSMNDIVWAINPLRDHVSDLTHRMRRFASEVLGARDIDLHFAAPDERRDFALGADVRREVWLIFKEAVNNIARHAACTRADVSLAVSHDSLALSIRDNGRGFDPQSAGDGNGLASMRQRAARLGGTLEVISQKGQGTAVNFRAPRRRRRRWTKSN